MLYLVRQGDVAIGLVSGGRNAFCGGCRRDGMITPDIIQHSASTSLLLLCYADRVRASERLRHTPPGTVGEVEGGRMMHNSAAGEVMGGKVKVVRVIVDGGLPGLVCLAYQQMRARAPNKDGVSGT
jgi:hypothetical protein